MIKKLDNLRKQVEGIRDQIESLRDKHQDTFDSRSERWQESEKGEGMQAKIDLLDDFLSVLEDFDVEVLIDTYKEYQES